MKMNDKIKTLKEKLQKMKVNRGNRQTGQMFHFSPFSKKQKSLPFTVHYSQMMRSKMKMVKRKMAWKRL